MTLPQIANSSNTAPLPNGKPQIVATYDYRDENGVRLFQSVRREPGADGAKKDFRQRQPDDKGGWKWNLKGVRLVPYRLPELLAADRSRLVFIVEGEKDVDNLIAMGLVATTNPMGAGKWKAEYNQYFDGLEVVIFPDNDDSGRSHTADVAQNLKGIAASVILVELPGLPDKGDVSDWLAVPGNDKRKLLEFVESASRVKEPESGPDNGGDGGDGGDVRPQIEITTEEHEVNAAATKALARDPELFQRGGLLVRIVRDSSPAGTTIRRPLAPRIEPLPTALLREKLAAVAKWVRVKRGKGNTRYAADRPPGWCVSAVHVRADWPGIRHLEAVVDHPVLRPDGSILFEPGYDSETGLLLAPMGPMPTIKTSPTLADAKAAIEELAEVVADFPFESPIHKSAWYASLLTPLARFAFKGPTPLFLVDSNVRGSGKGLLLDCNSHIVTGESHTVATYTTDDDELRKRITALALGGDRMVLFDNLGGKFGSPVLDAALTATSWKDRILGGNRLAEVSLYMTWYATGNNVAVGADTARRICHIRLESAEERPEERNGFRHANLLAWVKENRQRLLAAALTILRAYFIAGRPDMGLPAWGSYEGWSGVVRAALVWAGLPDPAETRLKLQDRADTTAEAMGVLLTAFEKLDPDRRGMTAAEIVQKVFKEAPTPAPDHYTDLRDAIESLAGRGDAKALGYKLRAFRRRIFAGRFLDHVSRGRNTVRWGVFPAIEFHRRGETFPPSPPSPLGAPAEAERDLGDSWEHPLDRLETSSAGSTI